jgi:FAD/FMN-containing dehydrogenase
LQRDGKLPEPFAQFGAPGEAALTEVADQGQQPAQPAAAAGAAAPAAPAAGTAAAAPPRPAVLPLHDAAVARIRREYEAIPPGTPVRLAKRTSNLFRFRDTAAGQTLDVSAFGRVLRVDKAARTALTGGMTTYEDLADATLLHGLMPMVVPQLKTITIGGAVSGLGIESTSLRNGMPHESVLEMEILTGDGRVVRAAPGGEHDALYHGFPNSYGTLGYALSLTIELEPVQPYVHLRHFQFQTPEDCMDAVAAIARDGSYQGHRADFVDGTMFSLDEMYLTVGAFSDLAPWRSDYTREHIYYQSVRGPREDFLTIRDYLWRWDTDWFWCSRPFGVQHPLVRRAWPRRYRRSDVYRRLVAFDRAHQLTARLAARRGTTSSEDVIQDVEIPVGRGAEFLRFFAKQVGMSPVWLCPLRLRGDRTWPLYPMQPGQVYVNFGFWGTVALPPGAADGHFNRQVEDTVGALGGHKGLYSTSFYSPEEFWARYNGPDYAALKRDYDADGRLADLYGKCVRGL